MPLPLILMVFVFPELTMVLCNGSIGELVTTFNEIKECFKNYFSQKSLTNISITLDRRMFLNGIWMYKYWNFYKAPVQPGSLDSEAGIFALTFDKSESRLISCEGDKTIKIYKVCLILPTHLPTHKTIFRKMKRPLKNQIRFCGSQKLQDESDFSKITTYTALFFHTPKCETEKKHRIKF